MIRQNTIIIVLIVILILALVYYFFIKPTPENFVIEKTKTSTDAREYRNDYEPNIFTNQRKLNDLELQRKLFDVSKVQAYGKK